MMSVDVENPWYKAKLRAAVEVHERNTRLAWRAVWFSCFMKFMNSAMLGIHGDSR